MNKPQKALMGVGAVAVILGLGGRLLAQAIDVIAPDTTPGYYALTVNPSPDAPADQQAANMAFGLERMSISTDHTFRFGVLRGTWTHSGNKISLTPNTTAAPFPTTTMAETLTVMTRPIDLTISADGKTLKADNAAKGPISFSKTSEAIR